MCVGGRGRDEKAFHFSFNPGTVYLKEDTIICIGARVATMVDNGKWNQDFVLESSKRIENVSIVNAPERRREEFCVWGKMENVSSIKKAVGGD